jgi:pimeloyl-ACP methyl ester carboxylesterase
MKNHILVVMCLLAAFSLSARADLNNGLVAYYPFNGNADDVSGNGNGATVYGATLTTNRFGTANAAYDFNGSSSYIDIPQNSGLNNLTTNFTLSAWIWQRSTNQNYGYRIIDKCPAGTPYGWTFDTLGNSSDRSLRLQAAAASNPNVAGATAYSLMQWHHVVATVSGTIGKVYLDGNLDGAGDVGNIPQNFLDIFIGRSHPYGSDPGNREYFNGMIDDVRIYNRALSGSEIQQLYSLSDIGPAPTPPTVVQTNRTPSSTELGVQTGGGFRVFTNGVFQTDVPLNPNLMTIVLTHGWNDNSDTWPSSMASQFVATGISANIVAWDWRDAAKSDTTPWGCESVLLKTPNQGYALGINLLQALGGGYSQPIHFIGHSFGTEVNAAAADYLQENGFASANIQMTLFDEAEIANDLRIVSPATWNLGWISPLPHNGNFAWADNYVSLVGELQNNAQTVNVILTEDQPAGFYASANDLWSALLNYHAEPCQWYGQTILNPSGSVMGDIWSFERNSTFTSPAAGTYFEQQGSGLSVSQITPADAALWQQFESVAFHRDLALFATLKGVDASVQVAGDVTANVVDTVLNDSTPTYITTPATIGISSYAPATPDFWSPQLILQTQPLSLPGPLNSQKAHPLDGPQPASSNSPAYAWLPMTIPTNGTSLSFDFMIQGDGASDSFAAAVNGTNVFSLPLNLLQTNIVMNSGAIDVSAYAGTNIELFVGIVGGTSTNASVSVSGFRIYTTMPPSLQAQASNGNLALSWPLSAQNFSVQTTTNLADPNSWTTLPDVPAIVNLQNAITNPISDGMRFYRLKQ